MVSLPVAATSRPAREGSKCDLRFSAGTTVLRMRRVRGEIIRRSPLPQERTLRHQPVFSAPKRAAHGPTSEGAIPFHGFVLA